MSDTTKAKSSKAAAASKSASKSAAPKRSESFKENYRILRETADWLSEQSSGGEDPDIDALVPKVEAAMQAYQACKERLDTVESQLSRHLGGEDS